MSDVSTCKSMHEVLESIGANFTVGTENAYVLRNISSNNSNLYHEVHGYKFIYRTDTGQVLGRCRTRWKPLQNRDAFARFQVLIDEGQVVPSNAGILGSKVWVLVKINRPPLIIRDGDTVEKYALIINGHDGGTALTVAYTPIRVYCTNMLPNMKGTLMTRVCHQKNMKDKIEAALDKADAEFDKLYDRLKWMANHEVDFDKYIKQVFDIKEPMSTRMKNIVEKIKSLHEGTATTYYDAYNAVCKYLNFYKGRPKSRLASLWFGPSAKQNRKALYEEISA